ncbi:MAG: T9SS type A sorting domain-containing protein [Bacteroidales bacterium]|nr:T9SS type A sorting domain-containing protein [Bacteroidales bacterium]
MKKTFIILALLATGMCASAQVDTLGLGDREPTYYYGNNPWWDEYALYDNVGAQVCWVSGGMPFDNECQPELAIHYYSDTALRVIGIVASLSYSFFRWGPDQKPDSVLIKAMQPEYFCLYEVDSTNDEMLLLAKGQWTSSMQPRYMIVNDVANYYYGTFYHYTPLYEVFFDSAKTVRDSFYLSVTHNNAYRHQGHGNIYYAYSRMNTIVCEDYSTSTGRHFDVSGINSKPGYFRRKLHLLDAVNHDGRFQVTDTNWHTFSRWYYNPADTNTPGAFRQYAYIFPIIDTSTVVLPPDCSVPFGLTIPFSEGGVATVAWTSGNAERWEVSICRDGCDPENGSVTSWNSTVATMTGLDTAQWYTLWVRSVCTFDDSIYYSDWSDSIRFYVTGTPNDPDDPEGIETTADRYTYLMPNPASETVTVASSFRIAEVELFSLDGRSLQRSKVDAMSTALNLDALAAGTYIVRIATNGGTAYKKLIVK